MDNSLHSPEQSALEREYDQSLDLCPLEHILIGSSTKIQGRLVNSDNMERENILDLLRPTGLTDGSSGIEEISEGRRKAKITGYSSCFDLNSYDLLSYGFDYIISPPDKNGQISNNFQLRFRRINGEGTSLTEQDLEVFRRLEMDQKFKSSFKLTRDEERGILTLEYIPLEGRGKQ